MAKKKIDFSKAELSGQLIVVSPNTVENYRALTKILRGKNISFHTYSLEWTRLRVVIRGIPKEFETSFVKENLLRQGLPLQEMHRIVNKTMRHPLQLSPRDS
ncbi:unnamed protein product [Parnassius apollo]|uniref:(apollo) hypothetical protein n=1 Tax=Parnassius apollo TaxID=110799 RepID=A0A8S3XDV9_PARAO|nr:unnamed protein product [Parnassius apollo]